MKDTQRQTSKKFSRRPNNTKRVQIAFPDQGRTKQSFKDECDINNILSRFNKTGQLPELIKSNPQYGDFSSVNDYQDSLNLVLHAQAQFAALSSRVRERFNNDPARFLEFTSNPKNAQEMIDLGLAQKRSSEGVSSPSSQPAPGSPKQPKKGGPSQPASPEPADA